MMPATRDDLFRRLDELGIKTRTIEHEAVFTVAESDKVERALPGGHTKNLFLKDKKGQLLLVVAEGRTAVDLKSLPAKLGVGRLSFAGAELLQEALGVTPGSVTVFALINDTEKRIAVVIDEKLMGYDSINGHPLTNTATTNIARDDLLRFIRSCGHEPRIVALGPASDSDAA
jgi:Ala-tRNA(Pro) deacylase